MLVYRICREPLTALDGEGSRLYGGRWNSAGKPAIYTSEHLSLAALEYLVHLDFDNLPVDLVWMKVKIPDSGSKEIYPESIAPGEQEAATFGDAWLAAKRSLILLAPAVVLSAERNVIINPLHPQMTAVTVLETKPFAFDSRLFKR